MSKNDGDNKFIDGIWCCVQYLVVSRDFPTIAAYIIKDLGISASDCIKAQARSGSYNERMNKFIIDEVSENPNRKK